MWPHQQTSSIYKPPYSQEPWIELLLRGKKSFLIFLPFTYIQFMGVGGFCPKGGKGVLASVSQSQKIFSLKRLLTDTFRKRIFSQH